MLPSYLIKILFVIWSALFVPLIISILSECLLLKIILKSKLRKIFKTVFLINFTTWLIFIVLFFSIHWYITMSNLLHIFLIPIIYLIVTIFFVFPILERNLAILDRRKVLLASLVSHVPVWSLVSYVHFYYFYTYWTI